MSDYVMCDDFSALENGAEKREQFAAKLRAAGIEVVLLEDFDEGGPGRESIDRFRDAMGYVVTVPENYEIAGIAYLMRKPAVVLRAEIAVDAERERELAEIGCHYVDSVDDAVARILLAKPIPVTRPPRFRAVDVGKFLTEPQVQEGHPLVWAMMVQASFLGLNEEGRAHPEVAFKAYRDAPILAFAGDTVDDILESFGKHVREMLEGRILRDTAAATPAKA